MTAPIGAMQLSKGLKSGVIKETFFESCGTLLQHGWPVPFRSTP